MYTVTSTHCSALAIDTGCSPRRALATLLSSGPKTLVYGDRAGLQGVLTVTYYDVSDM